MPHKTRHGLNERPAHAFPGLAEGEVVAYSGGELRGTGVQAGDLASILGFLHRKNADTALDEAGANAVTAAVLKAALVTLGALEVRVGTGETYTTVRAAVLAGKFKVRIVTNVTETADITFGPLSRLDVTINPDVTWNLSTYKLIAIDALFIFGSGKTGFNDSKITYTPLASNHVPCACNTMVLACVMVQNLQAPASGYSDTYFGAGGLDTILLDVLITQSSDSSGSRTVWRSAPNRMSVFVGVQMAGYGTDDIFIESFTSSVFAFWYGGSAESMVVGARGMAFENVKFSNVALGVDDATSTADFDNCWIDGSTESGITSNGDFNFVNCRISKTVLPNSKMVLNLTPSQCEGVEFLNTEINTAYCKLANSNLGTVALDEANHTMFSNCYILAYTATSVGGPADSIMSNCKVGHLSGGNTGVITLSAFCTLLANGCLLDDPISVGAGVLTAPNSITY